MNAKMINWVDFSSELMTGCYPFQHLCQLSTLNCTCVYCTQYRHCTLQSVGVCQSRRLGVKPLRWVDFLLKRCLFLWTQLCLVRSRAIEPDPQSTSISLISQSVKKKNILTKHLDQFHWAIGFSHLLKTKIKHMERVKHYKPSTWNISWFYQKCKWWRNYLVTNLVVELFWIFPYFQSDS